MDKAYHKIAARQMQNLFIFGDHASNYIPPQFNNLGLEPSELNRHIAWDIGTQTVIESLCDYFGCAGQLAAVSRLLIDFNREPERDSLIPQSSDGTIIPANQNLTAAARALRIEHYYTPYHQALADHLEFIEALDPLILSIHSFTPQLKGQAKRDLDIGLLMRHDEVSAKAFQSAMQAAYNYDIRINEPYSAYDLNYTIDHHLAPRGLRHLAIELRQDHITTNAGARAVAMQLAPIIKMLI